jgi:ADP-ribose pyrophosphatase
MREKLDLTEQMLRREDKFQGKIVSVHVDEVLLPNGNTSFREVVDHVDGVTVLALDDENCVLTVTQYRYVFGKTLLELPAGKLDPGEEPEATALREVREETGITGLFPGDIICITDHCYKRDGIWHLKHTLWYKMYHCDPDDLTPQKEEDITKVAWVAKSSLAPYLLNTYPSIVEVFREAGDLTRGEFFKLF